MAQIYFKISHQYFKDNIPALLRSLGDTTSSYIHTERTHLNFYKVLLDDGKCECVVCGRMIEVKVVDIGGNAEMETGTMFSFDIADKKTGIRHVVIEAKLLFETKGGYTFIAEIPEILLEKIKEPIENASS